MSQLQVVLVSLTDDQQRLDDYLSRYAGRLSVTHYSATHETIEVVLTQVWQQSPAAVLIDDADGEDAVFAALKNFRPTTEAHAPAVLMLGPNDVRRAVRAIKAGADDYLNRGELTAEQLMAALETCLTRHQPPIPIANSGAPSAVTTAPTWLPHLVERMPTLLYVFDLVEQRNIYANRLLGELLGYSLEQLKAIGSDLLATIMHPDDFARVPTHFAQFQGIADDEVIEFDFRVRHADGNWRWLSTHEIVFERQADGSPRRILGVSRDATQQKQSELTAKEHEERFRLIAETIRDVFWVADFRIPKILYISPAYTETWGRSPDEVYQNYQLWAETIHPEDRQRVIETAAQQLDQEMLEQEYRIIRPDGSIRWIRDRGFAVRDEAGNPLRTVGIAQDITERRQAESALAANEAKLQSFVESNVVGIIFGDIHGGIFTANDEFLRIVGYTRADLEAGRLQWIEMTPPEYLPLDEKRIAEAQSRGACTPYEKEYIRKDGKRTPVLIGFTLLGDRREESVVFVLDRKARKKTERALRRSEDRLRMAMESAQLGTWDWNLTKDQLTWDANCRAMFGVSADVPISLDVFFQGLHPDDHERLQQCIDDCMNPALGGRYEVEYRTIGIEDGIERWVLAKGQVYFEPNGRPKRFVGTVLDITERKQIELVLRESQERLQMAVKGSGGGLWHWNILTNEDYLSPEWLGMLGFAEGELPHKYSSWEKLIHPEDKAMVMELLYAHLQDETKPYEFEYRLMTKAGAWKWIANYGQVVDRDESGKPTKMAGIHLDISDRKQAEKRLQLSEARYRTLANAVSQLMWINDAAGNIEFFNQQWVDYTGVETLETGVGPWPEVIHPEDIERTYAVRSEAIAAKTSYEIEARIKRYDDTYYWHLVRVEPLFDDNDQVLNWFGTATNIHARKTIEAERERLFDQEKAARESAEQANRVKDEFLAILSHELRSPLNPILGWSQLLQSKEYDRDKTLQALEIIERNAKLQTQLVDDLLDVAKILRGKLELGYAPVNLSAVITAAI
ncbi:MAG: PAS domain-containing protein, partial [Leptolyngbyaceae cyanobacterium]